MQKAILREHVKKRGDLLVGTVCEAVSGISNDRAGLRQIKDVVRQKEVDKVLALSVSRFGRNITDVLNFARWLQGNGVSMELIKEGISADNSIFKELRDLV